MHAKPLQPALAKEFEAARQDMLGINAHIKEMSFPPTSMYQHMYRWCSMLLCKYANIKSLIACCPCCAIFEGSDQIGETTGVTLLVLASMAMENGGLPCRRRNDKACMSINHNGYWYVFSYFLPFLCSHSVSSFAWT